MSKVELLRKVVDEVDNGGVSIIGFIENLLKENGIENNMHVGKSKDFFDTDEKIAEWYLGQYLNIIDRQTWYVMNILIDQSYSWVKSREEQQ